MDFAIVKSSKPSFAAAANSILKSSKGTGVAVPGYASSDLFVKIYDSLNALDENGRTNILQKANVSFLNIYIYMYIMIYKTFENKNNSLMFNLGCFPI